jgi:DNA-binding transcriptional ArsR family regulator
MSAHDPQLDALFHALSDPTRRAVYARLMRGPAPVGELARPFGLSLPTVLAHLGKLEAGGLIETEKRGRTRICRARPAALDPVRSWIEDQQAMWHARLDRLEDYVTNLMKEGPNDP